MATVYDQERDVDGYMPGDFILGVSGHCGRLAGALTKVLETPGEPIVLELAQGVLDDFNAWYAVARPADGGDV
jgi:hypothetical protein